MAIDWHEIVRRNVRAIVRAAKELNLGDETVCVLLDLDSAHSGSASPGAMQLIADSQLQHAIRITSAEGTRIACLPIALRELVEIMRKYEDTDVYETRMKTSRNLILWAICFDGDERICIDIHRANHENN